MPATIAGDTNVSCWPLFIWRSRSTWAIVFAGVFYRFVYLPHRWAAAFLIGILLSTWCTYPLAIVFAATAQPLAWANLFYLLIVVLVLFSMRSVPIVDPAVRATKLNWRDALFLAAFAAISCWLMFGTLTMRDSDVRVTSAAWNDFGPNLALMQSFALGHNFPAEYPYFTGEPIRYHFLFWFQAGNLEFLGLSLATALNLLSALSMLALLISIMSLGQSLFGSRSIGGFAALLLFFHGSLSYIPFLRSHQSISGALQAVASLSHWLSSGFPYKGEEWGVWSPSILYVQRHLLAAGGIFCLVLTFLIDFYNQRSVAREPAVIEQTSNPPPVRSFIFSGVLIGLLVFWNSPMFVSALAVIGSLFLFLPGRIRVAGLLATALAIGLPQVLSLGFTQRMDRFPIFHWGYTIENPTLANTTVYFMFTFGPKLILAFLALVLLRKTQQLFFLAMASLVVLAFRTQLSVDIMNNQKFLYVWLILLNLFVAYALARIWSIRFVGKPTAFVLALIVMAGGVIELFRIQNDYWHDIPFRNNRLSKWLLQNTKPTDVFLTDRFMHHPILLNGRRIFYGWPYFPWSMGYRTADRDEIYRQMLTVENPDIVLDLLQHNGIKYVAIDDGVRNGYLHVRENLFALHLRKVYQDTENRFDNLNIYEVPR
jgi:hypothetical protein